MYFLKRRSLFTLFLVTTLLTINGTTSAQQVRSSAYSLMLKTLLKHDVPEISVFQISRPDTSDLFLDARSIQEYKVSHIRNARWVGYKSFSLSKIPVENKKEPIIVYCSVGYRSEKVAEKLQQTGYLHVKNLYGGIFEWVNEGRPVYDSSGVTRRVHAYNHLWGVWLRKGKKVY